MLAFRFNSTLFTHVIAANSIIEAVRESATLLESRIVEGTNSIPVEWQTPDIWTRRAAETAKAPGIIDAIPRFVVDRDDGPVYLDIDDVPSKLSDSEQVKCSNDHVVHRLWLNALQFDHAYSDKLRRHVATVASLVDNLSYAACVRALAGAWGLGPVPEWHAAILPALIALDIESTECTNAFCDNVFELDRTELIAELNRCALITHHVPDWYVASLRMLASGLSSDADTFALRVRANSVLALTGWLK